MINPTLASFKRVVCPECKGTKECFYYNETEHMNIQEPCRFCESEGIVFKVKHFQSLKHGK